MLMYWALRHQREQERSSVVSRTAGRWTQAGQATAEYALVILGAASLAGLVLAWAAGTGRITKLLNAVLDSVIGQIG